MRTPLVFIPGLGADSRLFYHQKKAFKKIITPSWLIPQKNESLTHYSRRWANHLKLKKGCVLVGVSFGGMVALEMSKWVKSKVVLLIGSCRSPSSIPLVLRTIGGLSGWPFIGKILTRIFPFGRGWFLGTETKDQQDLLMRMFYETPNHFLGWTLDAIRGWAGHKDDSVAIRHIHGDKDHLMPLKNVSPDQIVKGGGHTIILTHSKAVNDFIRKFL
jgi:pimeloyl-ACP methyl ester carboxylesterase